MIQNFHVVAIGPPRSGKTVYLSALHHVLVRTTFGPGISMRIEDSGQADLLGGIYAQAVDPNKPWPPGTGAAQTDPTHEPASPDLIREYKFRCAVTWTEARRWAPARTRSFRVFDVSYADYAGDILTRGSHYDPVLVKRFNKHLDDAHALLGVIDGQKLLEFMDGSSAARDFLDEHLRPVVEVMLGTAKPVHFVITKWDLFGKKTLGEVATRLLESEATEFKSLIEARTDARRAGQPVGTVRLIPVSAVGPLAYLDDAGRMEKDENKKATQENVEVPLICAVADTCNVVAFEWQQRYRARDRAQDGTPSMATPATDQTASEEATDAVVDATHRTHYSFSVFGVGHVELTVAQIVGAVFANGGTAARYLADTGRRTTVFLRRQARKAVAGNLHMVTSEETAVYYAQKRLDTIVRNFAAKYPESLLYAGDTPIAEQAPEALARRRRVLRIRRRRRAA